MKFTVGQTVVHLSHGKGIIKGIETREFTPGNVQKFYILYIQDNGAPKKVFVPFEMADQRLRSLSTKAECIKALEVLDSEPDQEWRTWNRRYREYMNALHSGEILATASVVRDLRALLNEGELSFGERKLLEQATNALESEVSEHGLTVWSEK